MDIIAAHGSLRCKACGGTGVSIRSNLDCTACDAVGIPRNAVDHARREAGRAVAAALDALFNGDEPVDFYDDYGNVRGAAAPRWMLAAVLARAKEGER